MALHTLVLACIYYDRNAYSWAVKMAELFALEQCRPLLCLHCVRVVQLLLSAIVTVFFVLDMCAQMTP